MVLAKEKFLCDFEKTCGYEKELPVFLNRIYLRDSQQGWVYNPPMNVGEGRRAEISKRWQSRMRPSEVEKQILLWQSLICQWNKGDKDVLEEEANG